MYIFWLRTDKTNWLRLAEVVTRLHVSARDTFNIELSCTTLIVFFYREKWKKEHSIISTDLWQTCGRVGTPNCALGCSFSDMLASKHWRIDWNGFHSSLKMSLSKTHTLPHCQNVHLGGMQGVTNIQIRQWSAAQLNKQLIYFNLGLGGLYSLIYNHNS